MLEIGAGLVAIAVACWFFLMRGKIGGGGSGNSAYEQKDDPAAQVRYDQKRDKDVPRLTAKQMLDLSWKFLYDITEIVLYKFSARAKRDIHECGKTLAENGMRYNHEVAKSPLAYGVKHVKKVDESREKNTQVQQGK
jgi:Protein of unknown function (DUF2660)